jgi:hypothetical protein
MIRQIICTSDPFLEWNAGMAIMRKAASTVFAQEEAVVFFIVFDAQ